MVASVFGRRLITILLHQRTKTRRVMPLQVDYVERSLVSALEKRNLSLRPDPLPGPRL